MTSTSYGAARASLSKPEAQPVEEPLRRRDWIAGIGILVAVVVAPAVIERVL